MRLLLSPAKNMVSAPREDARPPRFPAEVRRISDELRQYGPWKLESLMKLSPQLALRSASLIRDFDPDAPGTPAVLAYQGLCYQHLRPGDFSGEELRFAAEHLLILSALYGALGAMDGISPYRLDFLCRAKVDGKSLYRFWGDRIYRAAFEGGETVVNLASGEYSKTVIPFLSRGDRLVSCEFATRRKGKRITLPTEAKAARGEMARFAIQNRIEDPKRLRAFDWGGYEYQEALSGPDRMVFLK